MSIKETPNRDYEFIADFESHSIGDYNVYRLYYVNYHRIGEHYGITYNNIGRINWPCRPFCFPKGMSREEGFKVLSYLIDYIEKRDDIEACSLKSVMLLDSVLDLERLGFKRVEKYNEEKIINLFTVSGRLLLFKKSELYLKYFEWYVENVSLDDVKKIYVKYNMEFSDLVWLDNQNDNEQSKVLKLINKNGDNGDN